MKKNKIIIIILVILIGITIGAFYYFYTLNSNSSEQNNYEATRTSTNENRDVNTNTNSNNAKDTTEENENGTTSKNTNNEQTAPPTETTLSTFSTKIYTKEAARQNNINITCSSLNDTIVKAGNTFSFCSTVGQATTAKGYQKADIFDKNGNKKKGLRWWELSSK